MIRAVKVWCPRDEFEPEGLFNKATCPDTPDQWFAEDPEYAAQLYGITRGEGDYEIHVLDSDGVLHRFNTRVRRELNAYVKAAS